MHDARVVLASEYVARAAHIRGELVDFVDSLENLLREGLIPQIAQYKFVGGGLGEFMSFDIDRPYPAALLLQPFYEVSPDKPPGSVDQNSFHFSVSQCSFKITQNVFFYPYLPVHFRA